MKFLREIERFMWTQKIFQQYRDPENDGGISYKTQEKCFPTYSPIRSQVIMHDHQTHKHKICSFLLVSTCVSQYACMLMGIDSAT